MYSRKRMLKKFFVLLTILTILGLNVRPFATAHARSLVDVDLLRNVNVDAQLGNVAPAGPYSLKLDLSGQGVADVLLVNPEKTAVFYSKDLVGKWTPNGKATVHSELLPVSLNLLPTVTGTLDEVTNSLNGVYIGLINAVDGIVNDNGLTDDVIQIQGLDKLSNALYALNNLDQATTDLLVYDDQIEVKIGENGEAYVNFNDGLGTHLETAVNDVVLKLLNDVVAAINGLNVVVDLTKLPAEVLNSSVVDFLDDATGGILGGLLGLPLPILGTVQDNIAQLTSQLTIETDLLLAPVKALLPSVTVLVGQLTDTALDLSDDLISLQVLGNTDVSLNLDVKKPSGLNGDVKIYGALVKKGVIDLPLLSSLVDYDTVTFNEKADVVPTPVTTTPVTTTPVTTTPVTTTTATTTTSGSTLPNTSTDMWMYGLTGISTLIAGIGTRRFARRK